MKIIAIKFTHLSNNKKMKIMIITKIKIKIIINKCKMKVLTTLILLISHKIANLIL